MGMRTRRWIWGAGFAFVAMGCGGGEAEEATDETSCGAAADCEATDTGSGSPPTATTMAMHSAETTQNGDDTAAATDTTGTDTTGDTTAGTTGPEVCALDGELDPICVQRDPATPICTPGGRCVGCTGHTHICPCTHTPPHTLTH